MLFFRFSPNVFYFFLTGIKLVKTPGAALDKAEKFVAHMGQVSVGVAKFRQLQLDAILQR